jgi:hypothetical protein
VKIKPAITGWRPPHATPHQQPGTPRLQCEAIIPVPAGSYIKNWRQKRYETHGLRPECCQRLALYDIDGKRYCAIHAGKIALQYLFEEQNNGDN